MINCCGIRYTWRHTFLLLGDHCAFVFSRVELLQNFHQLSDARREPGRTVTLTVSQASFSTDAWRTLTLTVSQASFSTETCSF